MDDLLTAGDASRVIDQISPNRPLGPHGVKYAESVGKLPSLRTVGGVRLFKRSDVERFARARAAEDDFEDCVNL
jgi:hypothetical protein